MSLPKSVETALDMLPILAERAKERRTITYQELGTLLGKPAYFLGQSLDILRDRILAEHGLPRLDALVVSKETGDPGSSYYASGRDQLTDREYHDITAHEREQAYNYPRWDEVIAKLHAVYGGAAYSVKSGKST